jgi:carbon-monoxide dehydrogenase small subunit
VTTRVSFTLNGKPVTAEIEPRLSLADLLREQRHLTGTHLGCEHGVCGACTLSIDGRIMRSCITLAVACEGRDVRSIEGFDDDVEMAIIRQAFHEGHGLQCGFCTPGMLITARDILRRKPDIDEATLRVELSGNLCRCTGYAGIVRSILLAAKRLKDEGLQAKNP